MQGVAAACVDEIGNVVLFDTKRTSQKGYYDLWCIKHGTDEPVRLVRGEDVYNEEKGRGNGKPLLCACIGRLKEEGFAIYVIEEGSDLIRWCMLLKSGDNKAMVVQMSTRCAAENPPFLKPRGLALSHTRRVLFIADTGHGMIQAYNVDDAYGNRIAGGPNRHFHNGRQDGTGSGANFVSPRALALTPTSNLLCFDHDNGRHGRDARLRLLTFTKMGIGFENLGYCVVTTIDGIDCDRDMPLRIVCDASNVFVFTGRFCGLERFRLLDETSVETFELGPKEQRLMKLEPICFVPRTGRLFVHAVCNRDDVPVEWMDHLLTSDRNSDRLVRTRRNFPDVILLPCLVEIVLEYLFFPTW